MITDLKDIVAFPVSDGLRMLRLMDIEYVQSDANYSKVYLSDGEMVHVNRPLSALNEHLNNEICIRTHHQFLVNKYFTTAYNKKDGQLILKSGKKIPVSVRKRKEIIGFFKTLP